MSLIISNPQHAVSLRFVSHQNHFAAIKIQKVQRGHHKRLQLWRYGGKLMVSRVSKIQRCWRGLQGRRIAACKYRDKVLRAAHKIQGLYYLWHSRRLRLRAHLNFLNHAVILLQSYFRMRAAIQFSNVIRRALHNKKALKIQRQVRKMIGRVRYLDRKRKYQFVYKRLLGHIRRSIQNASKTSGNNNTSSMELIGFPSPSSSTNTSVTMELAALDLPVHEEMADQVVAFDDLLCNLVALGKYDTVKEIIGFMILASAGATQNVDYMSSTLVPESSVATQHGLALTAVYLGLSACWSRAGRTRHTRLDQMEEALGLMMQHSAVALIKAQCKIKQLTEAPAGADLGGFGEELGSWIPALSPGDSPHSRRRMSGDDELDVAQVGNRYCGLPQWLLGLQEDSVDLYYMCALRMAGVTSPYDTLLLLADWVWYQACVYQHNLAAVAMVNQCVQQIETARSALTDDSSQRLSKSLKTKSSGGSIKSTKAPVNPPPKGFSLANLVPGITNKVVEMNAIHEEPEVRIAEHSEQQSAASVAAKHEDGAFKRNFAIRRVHQLLLRAKKLLSADSRDRKEISDRIELFHDLHMTEHRAVLFDGRAFLLTYRNHYYDQQGLIDRQRAASREAAGSKAATAVPGQHRSTKGNAPPGSAGESTVGNNATNLMVDLQVILCGKTVLVKGSVLLHRLVEITDDLPKGSTLQPPKKIVTKSTKSVKYASDKKAEEEQAAELVDPSWGVFFEGSKKVATPPVRALPTNVPMLPPLDTIMVAIRPLVLLRAEVDVFINQINEELGLNDLMGLGHHDDASAASGTASVGGNSTIASHTQTATVSQAQSHTQTHTLQSDQQHSHQSHHHGRHHGHSLGEYARLGEYLRHHIRVISCQEQFQDPLVSTIVKKMRENARDSTRDRYQFTTKEEVNGETTGDKMWITPGVPSARFSLPVAEYRRRVLNEGQAVMHATRLLQRVFRGYRGRAKYRRMRWKRVEYTRQQEGTIAIRQAHDAVRRWRGERLNLVQRLFRGYRWRKRLHIMKCASLIVQCAFRVHRARKKMAAERRRRTEGAPVVPMLGLGRGVQIGEFRFTLKIFRSGTNYRLEGVDLLRGAVYEGAVYTPEVMSLISEHNSRVLGTTLSANSQRIMPWQHDRVVELIISNLGMMSTLQPVTTHMGAGGNRQVPKYILVANKRASPAAPPVQPPATMQQLHGSQSGSLLDLASSFTAKQRMQRHAEHRKDSKFRRQPTR